MVMHNINIHYINMYLTYSSRAYLYFYPAVKSQGLQQLEQNVLS